MKKNNTWRTKLYSIIFEADTKKGKWFDIILIIAIFTSIIIVMLESVDHIHHKYHKQLNYAEWFMTSLFTIEYILRIVAVQKPAKYIFSFYGIVDFLALIPKYLSLFFTGTHALVTLRALRMLRVFRVLKLPRYVGASKRLIVSLRSSSVGIAVFLLSIFILTIVLGTVMYLIEGPKNGFTSIPNSMYWAIVTLTTVGYGDISPQTPLGKLIASVIMILGYAIIAVPAGIFTTAMTRADQKASHQAEDCANCKPSQYPAGANYCPECGKRIHE